MLSHTCSVSFCGIDVMSVEVQVYITPGIPAFSIVGLADKTVAESRERVKAALSSMGLSLPSSKIVVNLSPADLLKEGSHFDLPIACAILAALNVIPSDEVANYIILGELALDSQILPVSGVLPAAMFAVDNGKGLICPVDNGKEASWSGNSDILAPKNLVSLANHFKGTQVLRMPEISNLDVVYNNYPDLENVIGQESVKRALEVAAVGGHNMLMSGPPGSGKSMLAERICGILPEMSSKEILECSKISSIAGLIRNGVLTKNRPFRAPHHSCSVAAMVGGGVGKKVRPGEISLAHNGVLFLDELPEFAPGVIDALRQPIETGSVLIARAGFHVSYPAQFQLIAAMNPCKCGYLSDPQKCCGKAPRCGQEYTNKISGPILDRFDIHATVPNIAEYWKINKNQKGESSAVVAERVARARAIQRERYEGYNITLNSQLNGQLLLDVATPDDDGLAMLNNAANRFGISMRGYNRVLRLARTIADMTENKNVKKIHIAEALSYRKMGENVYANA